MGRPVHVVLIEFSTISFLVCFLSFLPPSLLHLGRNICDLFVPPASCSSHLYDDISITLMFPDPKMPFGWMTYECEVIDSTCPEKTRNGEKMHQIQKGACFRWITDWVEGEAKIPGALSFLSTRAKLCCAIVFSVPLFYCEPSDSSPYCVGWKYEFKGFLSPKPPSCIFTVCGTLMDLVVLLWVAGVLVKWITATALQSSLQECERVGKLGLIVPPNKTVGICWREGGKGTCGEWWLFALRSRTVGKTCRNDWML